MSKRKSPDAEERARYCTDGTQRELDFETIFATWWPWPRENTS